MENLDLAEIIFKIVMGFSIPYAVKSLSEIRKSIEQLNTRMAVLIEKDLNKDRELEEQNEILKDQVKRMTEIEKKILALQLKRGQDD